MNWEGCSAVEVRPDKVSGAPVFAGTRIPVEALFENLKAGATVEEFLEWYPDAKREYVDAILSFVAGHDADAKAAA